MYQYIVSWARKRSSRESAWSDKAFSREALARLRNKIFDLTAKREFRREKEIFFFFFQLTRLIDQLFVWSNASRRSGPMPIWISTSIVYTDLENASKGVIANEKVCGVYIQRGWGFGIIERLSLSVYSIACANTGSARSSARSNQR